MNQDRRSYIGGHDIGAIIGVHPFQSEWDVWAAKVHGVAIAVTPRMETGLRLETAVLDWWAEANGWEIDGRNVHRKHPGCAFVGGSFDAIATKPGRRVIVDAKVTSGFGWTSNVPDYVQVQQQWYLGISQLDTAYIAALIGGVGPPETFEITADRDLQADLLNAGELWWERHIVGGEEPDPSSASPAIVSALYPEAAADRCALDDDTAQAVADLVVARAARKAAEADESRAAAFVKARMGDAGEGWYAGERIVTWKNRRFSSVDMRALTADHPDMVDTYRRASVSRVLLCK